MTFSKRSLRARQFCRTIAVFWQPTVAKWFASKSPFFGEPKHCPLPAIHTRCRNPASLGAVNTGNLPARCVGVGVDPFAFSEVDAMAVTRLSVVTVCFSSFWPHPLTIFKSFKPFSSFFFFENKPLCLTHAVSQTSAKAKPGSRAPWPLGVFPLPSPVQQMQETFHICLYQHGFPHTLRSSPALMSSSGLRQEAWESALHAITAHPVDKIVLCTVLYIYWKSLATLPTENVFFYNKWLNAAKLTIRKSELGVHKTH